MGRLHERGDCAQRQPSGRATVRGARDNRQGGRAAQYHWSQHGSGTATAKRGACRPWLCPTCGPCVGRPRGHQTCYACDMSVAADCYVVAADDGTLSGYRLSDGQRIWVGMPAIPNVAPKISRDGRFAAARRRRARRCWRVDEARSRARMGGDWRSILQLCAGWRTCRVQSIRHGHAIGESFERAIRRAPLARARPVRNSPSTPQPAESRSAGRRRAGDCLGHGAGRVPSFHSGALRNRASPGIRAANIWPFGRPRRDQAVERQDG